MLPLGAIFKKYKISYHYYADDTQFYLPAKTDCSDSLDVLYDCLEAINAIKWKQKLNSDSSSVFQLGSLSASVQPYVRNIGVTFDSLFNFKKQISIVVKGSFFHLRSIAELKLIM